MCSNYQPPKRDQYIDELEWPIPTFEHKAETYPGYLAPIKLLAHETGEAELCEAMFGLVPFWSKDDKISRQTYNARTETVASKPSYREPWKKRRYALVPMAAFYEPDYETGKAVRWKIERQDQRAFTVAAIWDYWKKPTGEGLHSFSMLTINADGHPVMGRFHKPGDEKRSLVIVPPERRDEWLRATPEEAGSFLQAMPADEFTSLAAPLVRMKT
jgi:putative SOS response-associated peptidase YedK